MVVKIRIVSTFVPPVSTTSIVSQIGENVNGYSIYLLVVKECVFCMYFMACGMVFFGFCEVY